MDTILYEVGKRLIPYIQLFGIYIIINGHLSPGGGFAGGTILGVSFILSRLINGEEWFVRKPAYRRIMTAMGAALGLYGIIKGYSFFTGGAELHLWEMPIGIPGRILSGGLLLPLNIIVGIVVGITIYMFYCLFDRGDL